MSDYKPKGRPLTGRKVLLIAVGAFAVILSANLTMLFAATGTFPGLVVENSYRAGVGWDDRAAAQEALGWQVAVGHEDGRLIARIEDTDGRPVEGLALEALVGRPATDTEDRTVALAAQDGAYAHPVVLEAGLWRVALTATRPDGTEFRTVAKLDIDADAGAGG